MPADAQPPAGAQSAPERHAERPRPIEIGPRGKLVWDALRAAWLTHSVVASREMHVKGGYGWDAASYLPVMMMDDEGDPFLAFARSASGSGEP